MSKNIAIDGPAGAGKSTIAKKLAAKLGYIYVDTGAMYRAIGLYFTRMGISMEDTQAMGIHCLEAEVEIRYVEGEQQVFLNDENVNALIRTEEAGLMASACAKVQAVRTRLVSLQRNLAKKADVVMDGRDIGTVVLPKADLKIFLTASVKTRAKRRYAELQEKGVDCDLNQIEQDIRARDEQDMNREISPLKQADDAYLLDSSALTIDQVVDKICAML